MKAVRFDRYGPVEVLKVEDVPTPAPGPGQVLVRVRAAGINPGEVKIREGLLDSRWPATFPSGQGSDLAGVVEQAGPGAAGIPLDDEVIGWVDTRSSQAEYAVVEAANLTPKPAAVPWEVAGGLARHAGAIVIGLASEVNHAWLSAHGVIPVSYGDGVADRIRAVAPKADAFIDTYGGDYVELALDDLGVSPARVDTLVRFDAVGKYGVKAEGNAAGASAAVLRELAGLVAAGELEVPVAATYPLAQVREAYARLAAGHVCGKIVLLPRPTKTPGSSLTATRATADTSPDGAHSARRETH